MEQIIHKIEAGNLVIHLLCQVFTRWYNYFMKFAVNFQLLFDSMYLGQLGDIASIISESLDVTNADHTSQHYYWKLETLYMASIDVLNCLKEHALKQVILKLYLEDNKNYSLFDDNRKRLR